VLRSWDGPNSRVGFELDLNKMPWGPFDALGKRIALLLPSVPDAEDETESLETQMERALRHVEHAADRCADFASLGEGSDENWRESLRTWEWIRDRLTGEWLRNEVGPEEGVEEEPETATEASPGEPVLPLMPGAAGTLEVVGRALRAIPLAQWERIVGNGDPNAPTREEAVQTLLGVARIMGGTADPAGGFSAPESPGEPKGSDPVLTPQADVPDGPSSTRSPEARPRPGAEAHNEPGPGEVSFDYAQGFDEGYQIGRRVGRALGSRLRPSSSG
jgi:hypothetical protein